jgi:hypothetical protein
MQERKRGTGRVGRSQEIKGVQLRQRVYLKALTCVKSIEGESRRTFGSQVAFNLG